VNPISLSGAQQNPVVLLSIAPQRPLLSIDTLEEIIRPSIALLYGETNADVICERISRIVTRMRKARPLALRRQDEARKPDWYKNIVLYSLYADTFAVEDVQKPATFDTLSEHLDYLTRLGVDTIHVLPFLSSPMVDGGFDISNYTQVRPELGGNRAFRRFLKKAKARNLSVMMDMVLNHASDQHPYFQAALQGDLDKIGRFLYRREKPQTKRLHVPGEGIVVEYPDGSRIRLMLSDNSEAHYNPSVVCGKTRYFYSTFMPQQKDWNWKNPDVMYDHLKNLCFWANQGIDIFRLDALPFLVKEPGTNGENTPGMHAVIKTLSACLQVLAPSTVLLAEAAAPPEELRQYFGQEQEVVAGSLPPFSRTDEVQMTYNFPLMSAIWTAFVSKDASPVLRTLSEAPTLAASATQLNFLRVHDELSMERANPDWQKAVYEALAPKGEGCRGGIGVAGRLANFIDQDPRQATLLYSILFSLPGTPLLYYGDELLTLNNPEYMLKTAKQRAARLGKPEVELLQAPELAQYIDKRDLNRGPLFATELHKVLEGGDSLGSQVFRALQRMIALRKHHPSLSEGGLTLVPAQEAGVLCYLREAEQQRILIVQNLSGQAVQSTVQMPSEDLASEVASKGLWDLLSDQIVSARAGDDNTTVQLSLEPYQAFWLKLS
jgi:maltose alpha-D-glucosyltransferase/alpha-amylase